MLGFGFPGLAGEHHEAQVCWPDKQPDGVDLSVLKTQIRSGGMLLFSRTLRLTQRFGSSAVKSETRLVLGLDDCMEKHGRAWEVTLS